MVCIKAWRLFSFIKCKLTNYDSSSHIVMEKEICVCMAEPQIFIYSQTSRVFQLVSFPSFGWVPFIYIIDKAAPDCSNNRCVALLLRRTPLLTPTKDQTHHHGFALKVWNERNPQEPGEEQVSKGKAVFALEAPYFPGEMAGKVFSGLRFHSKGWWNIDSCISISSVRAEPT